MERLNLDIPKLVQEESGNIILAPLLYFDYKDKVEQGREYLPFSIGIEIECDFTQEFNMEVFKAIPYLMDSSKSIGEIRFRIPSGVQGLICLYLACEYLKYRAIPKRW